MYYLSLGQCGNSSGYINPNTFIIPTFESVNVPQMHTLSGEVHLRFASVNQIQKIDELGNKITTYTKDNYVDVKDDEGNVIVKKNEPIDFDKEMNDIISEIENCVANHDPTPVAPPKTELELLKERNEKLESDMATIVSVIIKDRGYA